MIPILKKNCFVKANCVSPAWVDGVSVLSSFIQSSNDAENLQHRTNSALFIINGYKEIQLCSKVIKNFLK